MIAPVLRFFMRVCMEPRLLPGVRWSTLKIVKSWPSCWITMPGRSCVALTLLIIFDGRAGRGLLKNCRFRKFRLTAATPQNGYARNDLPTNGGQARGALKQKIASSANNKYSGPHSQRSIATHFAFGIAFIFHDGNCLSEVANSARPLFGRKPGQEVIKKIRKLRRH